VCASSLSEEAPSVRTDLALHVAGELPLGGSALSPRLRVALGLWRATPATGWNASHELALESSLGPLALHLTHRSAYTPPALADQYFREGVGVRPNPDLRGERVPGELEGGASLQGGGSRWEGRAALAAWAGDVEGMIVWAPDYRFVWSPRNVDVRRRGVEANAELRLLVGAGQVTLATHWTHARTTYDRPGDDQVQVAYRPRSLGWFRVFWNGAGWEGDIEARRTGVRYPFAATVNPLPSFWTTDLGVSHRFALGAWTLTPAVRVSRLLANTDALVFGFPEPGRTLALTLSAGRSARQ
jgi:iron complex outermembrane receptor protein